MASTFAKKHTNYLVSYFWFPFIVFFLFYVIIVIFLSLLSFWVDPTHFLCYINILLIKHTNVNSTSLYLKKAGLASRKYSIPSNISPMLYRSLLLYFYFYFVKPIRSLVLIQRIPAGLSSHGYLLKTCHKNSHCRSHCVQIFTWTRELP